MPATYRKAVRWAVDEFFSRLSQRLSGKDVLVIYTSDHGQNFADKTAGPHASSTNPPRDQANVPLLVWPMGDTVRRQFDSAGGYDSRQFDRAWHFQLFPTLLIMMGYGKDEVAATFSGSLFDPPPERRRFLSGYLAAGEFGAWQEGGMLNDFDD